MGTPPSISLVILARVCEAHIAAAVGSLLRQTRGDFEAIVWDDGSTDRTAEVARNAVRNDPRVRVVKGERRGLSASLNAAARTLSGRYFGWIDGDGALAPDALQRTAALLEARADAGMVYTQYVTMDETGRVGGLGKACAIPYSKERLLVDFMTFQFRLMRRAAFDAVGGMDESLNHAQDYDLCLKLSETTPILHCAEALYFHRVHDDLPALEERVSQIHADRDVIARALDRRGLSGAFEVDVEIVGSFELRRKGQPSGVARSAQPAAGSFTPDWSLLSAGAPARDSADHGLVSCLCVTRGRGRHLGRALECFRAQTYRNRELVVVYEELDPSARELLARPDERIRLVHVPPTPKQPLGALRNLSLASARGAYVCGWDDDDWYPARRIELQLRHLLQAGADACVLSRWLMVDETTRRAYRSTQRLWEGSLLCRKDLSALQEGYPPLVRSEDAVLVARLRACHVVAVLEQPELYVYSYHGANTWERAHFLELIANASELPAVDAVRLANITSQVSTASMPTGRPLDSEGPPPRAGAVPDAPAVHVVTLQFGGLSYFPLSTEINTRYCERHGLRFLVRTPGVRTDRHPVWFKVKVVLDELSRCDYVLFMDADAVFVDHERPIETLLGRLETDRVMLLGADRMSPVIGWNDNAANTGVFLIKNHPSAFELLTRWWELPATDPSVAFSWPLDQAGFNRHLLAPYRSRVSLVDYRTLNGVDGDYIRHFMLPGVEAKTAALTREFEQLSALYGWSH